MKIFEYDLDKIDIETLNVTFQHFKEAAEKEGEVAIAIPKDIAVYEDVSEKTLYEVREIIDKELKRKSEVKATEYRKSKQDYLGKCFIGEDTIIKILDYDFNNQYAMICLVLEYNADKSNEDIILSFDSIGLFCNDYHNSGHKVIEQYKEISEEEFKARFKTRIYEICFGEFKCQG
jgi:hypothetical protein